MAVNPAWSQGVSGEMLVLADMAQKARLPVASFVAQILSKRMPPSVLYAPAPKRTEPAAPAFPRGPRSEK